MSYVEGDTLTAEVVAEYLRDNPDFFQNRKDLVDRLAINNVEQGAVSLVEIQLKRQRHRIEELEEEITGLMSLAANNDKTFYEFMDLQTQVLKCSDFIQVIKAVEQKALELGLKAHVRVLSQLGFYQLNEERYSKFALNHFNGKDAYLGRLRKADRHDLFGDYPVPELGSYVVLPLAKRSPLGVLAFSSEDGGHFQPHMDTLFLRHLALVVAHLADTLPWQINNEPRAQNTSS
ncbi:DUF484 family protein [Vibrio sp. 10N.261.46.E11]|uniref:DUF484 family protein n=1 Tax=Vibrio sp. 10N.261.46.E11 TaxID=3229662 RepID=UPI0035515116